MEYPPKSLLFQFLDLVLYGNFWIAFGAVALSLQTQFLFFYTIAPDALVFFIFFATLFLYAIHRIVGLQKVKRFQDQGRYLVIARYKSHIFLYALCSLIGSIYFFFQLQRLTQLSLIIPTLLSLGYAIPFLKGNKRLRDLHFLKIFLIAMVWSWVTVALPALEWQLYKHIPLWLLFMERFLFIFAITIPFDIRDVSIDRHTNVKTIPAILGLKKAKRLALLLLALSFLPIYLNYHTDAYSFSSLLAYLCSLSTTAILVSFSDQVQKDYFFTGLLDGTMAFQFILIYYFNLF